MKKPKFSIVNSTTIIDYSRTVKIGAHVLFWHNGERCEGIASEVLNETKANRILIKGPKMQVKLLHWREGQ